MAKSNWFLYRYQLAGLAKFLEVSENMKNNHNFYWCFSDTIHSYSVWGRTQNCPKWFSFWNKPFSCRTYQNGLRCWHHLYKTGTKHLPGTQRWSINPGGLYTHDTDFKGYPPWNKQQESSPLQIGRTCPKRKLDRKLVFQPLFFRGELLVSGRVDVHIPLKKGHRFDRATRFSLVAGLKQLSFRVEGVCTGVGWGDSRHFGKLFASRKELGRIFCLKKHEAIVFD